MMAKLSTRRYRAWVAELVGTRGGRPPARSTSKSSVCRVGSWTRTETALAELMSADLTGAVDVVALMIDWVHFAGHCCVVALGIGIDTTTLVWLRDDLINANSGQGSPR